jgi:hypothetical protein
MTTDSLIKLVNEYWLARLNGKPFEVEFKDDTKKWHYQPTPNFNPAFEWRKKPSEEDKRLAEQHALKDAWEKEKFHIQFKYYKETLWQDLDKPCWNFNDGEYRGKPEPRYVPWTFEDITPDIAGAWFKSVNPSAAEFWIISIINKDGFCLANSQTICYAVLQEFYLYSTDLKTWHRCGKEVSE